MYNTGFKLKFAFILALTAFSQLCRSQQFLPDTETFHPLYAGNIKWSDLDNDKDLDVIYFGFEDGANDFDTKVYENQNGNFVEKATTLPQLRNGAIELGDFDNDGDADILLSGLSIGGNISELHENLGGFNFTRKNSFPGLINTSIAIFDIDNDEDLDFVLNGFNDAPVDENTIQKAEVYVYKNNLVEFVPVLNTNIRPCTYCVMEAGDSNGDGLVDLAVAAFEDDGLLYTYLYINVKDFKFHSEEKQNFKHLFGNSLKWVDYDNDGDLDLFMNGMQSGATLTECIIYENTPYGWVEHDDFFEIPLFQNLSDGAQWQDINNDGYLDLLVTGQNLSINQELQLLIYINNSGQTFTKSSTEGLEGISDGAIDVGDYDNDGDLDIAFTGLSNGYPITGIYTNQHINSGFQPNGKPLAPNLTSFKEENFYRKSLQLKWGNGSDDKTNANAIMYNFYIRSSSKKLVVPSVNYLNGYVRSSIVPNGSMGVAKVIDLPEGTLHWAVQSIDGGRLGSNFSNEKIFYHLNGPESRRAEIISPQQVRLTWIDNSTIETNYKIERSRDIDGGFQVLAMNGQNTTMYTDNFNFLTETYYYYRISASNSIKQSGYDTLRVVIPIAPANLSSVSINAATIDLSWSDRSLYESSYLLERRKVGDSDFEIIDTLVSNTQSYTDRDLMEGTQYEYRVKAINYYGSSLYSNIVIERTNHKPIGQDISSKLAEDEIKMFSSQMFIAAFSDLDQNDQLKKVMIASLPLNGILYLNDVPFASDVGLSVDELSDFNYKPGSNYNGTDSFTFKVGDGKDYSILSYTVSLEITPVNDFPVFTIQQVVEVNEDFAGSIKIKPQSGPIPANESDQKIVYSLAPLNSDIAATQIDLNTGEIMFQSKLNKTGIQEFTITADDGQQENNLYSKVVQLKINPVNDAPVISEIDNLEAEINTSVPLIDFQVSDIDDEVSNLIVTTSSSNTAIVRNEKIVIQGSGANRKLQIFPESNVLGSTSIKVEVSDGKINSSTEFEVTIFQVTSVGDTFFDSFEMYPNPTNSSFKIVLPSVKSDNVTVVISDMLGKEYIRQAFSRIDTELNIDELATGHYWIRLYSSNELIYSNRIIKN